MDVFLTGGTGLVGSAVLRALLADGHVVHALARSETSAATLQGAGACVVRGELSDAAVVGSAAAAADATIHAGSPGDATSADMDRAVAQAVTTHAPGKPYVHTGGIWIFGSGADLTEQSPTNPPALTAWRPPIEETVLAAGGSIVAPGIVYGHGGGLPGLLVQAPRTAGTDPALLFPGSGDQHWTTIYADDLGRLYVAVLGAGPRQYVFGASGDNPTVRALAEAASHAAGLDGRVAPEPAADTESRLGPLAQALEIDQQTAGAAARALGWTPTGPSLIDELATGSYALRP
jgi:nucleoside-diphosphate-sugar epimerase